MAPHHTTTFRRMSALIIRPMLPADAAQVASLHAESWRTAYREILSEAFLADEVDDERLQHWQLRLIDPRVDNQFGLVGLSGDRPVGFVYVENVAHPQYGVLLDNLHVVSAARSSGIGPQLMSAAAAEALTRGWGPAMHLWVFAANQRARVFYTRMGGREVECTSKELFGGGEADTVRVVWDECRALIMSSPG